MIHSHYTITRLNIVPNSAYMYIIISIQCYTAPVYSPDAGCVKIKIHLNNTKYASIQTTHIINHVTHCKIW